MLFAVFNRIDTRYLIKIGALTRLVENGRRLALVALGAEIPVNSYIRSRLYINNPRFFKMGARSKIGPNAQLFLYDRFEIGDDVEIGSSLIVHTAEHRFPDIQQPIAKQGAQFIPVHIGSNVYIGSRVTLTAGVHIENQVIVAAGAVVKDNLPSGYVYGGVPAIKIRKIWKDQLSHHYS